MQLNKSHAERTGSAVILVPAWLWGGSVTSPLCCFGEQRGSRSASLLLQIHLPEPAQHEVGLVPSAGQGGIPGKGWGVVGQPLAAVEVLLARRGPQYSHRRWLYFSLVRPRGSKLGGVAKSSRLQRALHDDSGLAYLEPLAAGRPLILKPEHWQGSRGTFRLRPGRRFFIRSVPASYLPWNCLPRDVFSYFSRYLRAPFGLFGVTRQNTVLYWAECFKCTFLPHRASIRAYTDAPHICLSLYVNLQQIIKIEWNICILLKRKRSCCDISIYGQEMFWQNILIKSICQKLRCWKKYIVFKQIPWWMEWAETVNK